MQEGQFPRFKAEIKEIQEDLSARLYGARTSDEFLQIRPLVDVCEEMRNRLDPFDLSSMSPEGLSDFAYELARMAPSDETPGPAVQSDHGEGKTEISGVKEADVTTQISRIRARLVRAAFNDIFEFGRKSEQVAKRGPGRPRGTESTSTPSDIESTPAFQKRVDEYLSQLQRIVNDYSASHPEHTEIIKTAKAFRKLPDNLKLQLQYLPFMRLAGGSNPEEIRVNAEKLMDSGVEFESLAARRALQSIFPQFSERSAASAYAFVSPEFRNGLLGDNPWWDKVAPFREIV